MNTPYAFPRVDNDTLPENDVMGEYQRGMTLRDYFAAKAMHAAIMAGVEITSAEEKGAPIEVLTANAAYRMADAMLAERAK